MSSFSISLVCPDALVFTGEADQVDLPGAEGDMGVLAGHVPIVAALRPGIVKIISNGQDEKFVVLGGVAEVSRDELTILADAARRIDDFDILGLRAEIEERERGLRAIPLGRELDREIALLDHYKTLHRHLTATTAF